MSEAKHFPTLNEKLAKGEIGPGSTKRRLDPPPSEPKCPHGEPLDGPTCPACTLASLRVPSDGDEGEPVAWLVEFQDDDGVWREVGIVRSREGREVGDWRWTPLYAALRATPPVPSEGLRDQIAGMIWDSTWNAPDADEDDGTIPWEEALNDDATADHFDDEIFRCRHLADRILALVRGGGEGERDG